VSRLRFVLAAICVTAATAAFAAKSDSELSKLARDAALGSVESRQALE